jgi:hypothetical protein
MVNIPLVVSLGADGVIIDGPHRGEPHHYKTALFNTLIALRPKVCLEIGTLHGGTAVVFERYFREYQNDGILISVDIKLYNNLNLEHVVQVKWYPHVAWFNDLHNVDESDLLPDGARLWRNSVELNTRILRDELRRWGKHEFDMCFVDGDHRKASVVKDLEICKAVLAPPGYMLLEDVREGIHEVSAFYENEVKQQYEHFDFGEWPVLSGCALIWSGEA